MQDNGKFKIDIKKAPKGTNSRVYRYDKGTALSTMGASAYSISNPAENVKQKTSRAIDAEYRISADIMEEYLNVNKQVNDISARQDEYENSEEYNTLLTTTIAYDKWLTQWRIPPGLSPTIINRWEEANRPSLLRLMKV